jgi:hypothetical protein
MKLREQRWALYVIAAPIQAVAGPSKPGVKTTHNKIGLRYEGRNVALLEITLPNCLDLGRGSSRFNNASKKLVARITDLPAGLNRAVDFRSSGKRVGKIQFADSAL